MIRSDFFFKKKVMNMNGTCSFTVIKSASQTASPKSSKAVSQAYLTDELKTLRFKK